MELDYIGNKDVIVNRNFYDDFRHPSSRRAHWEALILNKSPIETLPVGNESVPIQLAQCRFRGLAISSAKILIYTFFSNKIYGSNFIKQHSETVMVWNYQNADCSIRKKYCVIYYNFRHTFVPYCYAIDCSLLTSTFTWVYVSSVLCTTLQVASCIWPAIYNVASRSEQPLGPHLQNILR